MHANRNNSAMLCVPQYATHSHSSDRFQQEAAVAVVVAANCVRIVERRMAADEHAGRTQHPEQSGTGTHQVQKRCRHNGDEGTAMRRRQHHGLVEQLDGRRVGGGASSPDLAIGTGRHDDQE